MVLRMSTEDMIPGSETKNFITHGRRRGQSVSIRTSSLSPSFYRAVSARAVQCDKGGNPESREPESSVTGTKFVCPLFLRQYLYLPRLFAI